jgi:hypothetical protein
MSAVGFCEHWMTMLEEVSDWLRMKKDIEEFYLEGYNACSPLKVNRPFGGTCLHLKGQVISRARNQRETR